MWAFHGLLTEDPLCSYLGNLRLEQRTARRSKDTDEIFPFSFFFFFGQSRKIQAPMMNMKQIPWVNPRKSRGSPEKPVENPILKY